MSVHAPGPPYPGDPARPGGFRVLGRPSAGGQGVVYLAEADGGEPVAAKRCGDSDCR
ncbi:hypothetical protein [Actinomadura sp. 9N215]|uniref:hypothetical protein n=1 Tax=Actinomadura sp. 9N215 TaxID=3375150 RepID=UPI0037A42479